MESEEILNIYLGQDEHYITLEEMNKIVYCVNAIGNSLAEKIFMPQSQKAILIYPCENGSFKIKIGVVVFGAWALMSWFGDTDSGKAFIKGLTGHETPYYWEKGGELLRDVIKGVLESDISKLEYINNVNTGNRYILDKCIKEKSEFYEIINKSETIKSISFNANNKDPIKKNLFYTHIKKGDIIRTLEPNYQIRDFVIVKSINTEKQSKWTFKEIDNNKSTNAEIRDKNFITQFLNGKHPLKEGNQDDVIKALLCIETVMKNGSKESEQYFIEEIFNFNENRIKDIPQEFEKYLQKKYDYKNPSLFDFNLSEQ